MNFATLTVMGLALFVTSCGDVARGRDATGSRTTPAITTDTNTFHEVASQMSRVKSTPVLTFAQEIAAMTSTVGSGYRPIPSLFSDEGSGISVNTQSSIGRPNKNCGTESGTGILTKISDCVTENKALATWKGSENASNGEANWNLVYRTDTTELWLDGRTNMVWSPVMTAANWCSASGNTDNLGFLDSDCKTIGASLSYCTNLKFATIGSKIVWRLPTRNDYLQADLDGLRFVLDNSTPHKLWTATIQSSSTDRSMAWLYSDKDGTLSPLPLTTEASFRCIGSPVL